MTKEKPTNMAASVRERLRNLARQRQEDFALVLSRYALERLLQRIDQSTSRDRFIVKGALLFLSPLDRSALSTNAGHRPARSWRPYA